MMNNMVLISDEKYELLDYSEKVRFHDSLYRDSYEIEINIKYLIPYITEDVYPEFRVEHYIHDMYILYNGELFSFKNNYIQSWIDGLNSTIYHISSHEKNTSIIETEDNKNILEYYKKALRLEKINRIIDDE